MNLEVERRMLETLKRLIESAIADAAISVCNVQPQLAGWARIVARLAIDEFDKRLLEGGINLYTVTGEEVDLLIVDVINLAANKVTGSRLVKTPKGGGSPWAPTNDCTCGR